MKDEVGEDLAWHFRWRTVAAKALSRGAVWLELSARSRSCSFGLVCPGQCHCTSGEWDSVWSVPSLTFRPALVWTVHFIVNNYEKKFVDFFFWYSGKLLNDFKQEVTRCEFKRLFRLPEEEWLLGESRQDSLKETREMVGPG